MLSVGIIGGTGYTGKYLIEYCNNHPFIDDLFKALGVEQKMVRSLDLHILVDDVVTVEIKYLADSDDLDQSDVLKRYVLSVDEIVEKEDK